MAIIVIKDLIDSVDLDRQAMMSIIGGARTCGRRPAVDQASLRGSILGRAFPLLARPSDKGR